MAVGNAELIDALTRVKSNIDSGVPNAIQRMAIAALEGPQDCIEEHKRIYQRRRDRLVEALCAIGLRVTRPKAGLYLWAGLPLPAPARRAGGGRRGDGVSSIEFAERLLEETGVVVTPGVGYGRQGEGYVRLSLTVPDDRLEEGVRRLQAWRWE
jgi:LL-diaminopimelate aminotransferase